MRSNAVPVTIAAPQAGATPAAGSSIPIPEVGVVIPTRDRPQALARCLAALDAQTCECLEIVVVDDGSRDEARIREVVASSPRARLVRLAHVGAAAARNAGAAATAAPVVCFTADDCEPAPDWAERLAARLAAGAEVVAGPIDNGSPEDPIGSAAHIVARCLMDHALRPDGTTVFSGADNLACRAEVLRAIPFDETYGITGGEDRDWCARIVAAGRSFVAEPSAIVLHRRELTLAGFWRQQVYYGSCSSRFRRTTPSARRLEPPGFYIGLLRSGFRHGPATGALVVVAQVAAAVGYLKDRLASRPSP